MSFSDLKSWRPLRNKPGSLISGTFSINDLGPDVGRARFQVKRSGKRIGTPVETHQEAAKVAETEFRKRENRARSET